MDPVVHFEMPYVDKNRAAEFYGKTFGWKANMLGADMGEYVVMMTSETDEKTHRPKNPGRIDGGMYKRPEDPMGQAPSVVIAVQDIEASMQKVKEAGGEVIGEPMDIPGVGKYVSFKDTEGNRVSMLQPTPSM